MDRQSATISPTISAPTRAADPLHSGASVTRYYAAHLQGALLPLSAGMLLYGWRAIVLVGVIVLSATAALFVWRRIGRRGGQLHWAHGVWLATLMSMVLPAHLVSTGESTFGGGVALWPILPAAGIALIIFTWVLGGLGAGRLHPVVLAYLLVAVLFAHDLVPHSVLQRNYLLAGDVLDAPRYTPPPLRIQQAWIHAEPLPDRQAIRTEPASERLTYFTSFFDPPDRAWLSLEALLRDRLPPLEDLVIAGQPAPIGSASAVAVIVGGLFLIYRGLIDFRVPLLVCVSAFVCFLILPIPVVMTEIAREWRWFALAEPGVGPALAVTFANYQLLASPLLFVAFFLATDPAIQPMTRRGRTVYAVLLGVFTALFQLYAAVALGPFLALLFISLLTPFLDKWLRPKPLVDLDLAPARAQAF